MIYEKGNICSSDASRIFVEEFLAHALARVVHLSAACDPALNLHPNSLYQGTAIRGGVVGSVQLERLFR